MLTAGELTGGGFHWRGMNFSSGMRYRETAIMVPFVRLRGQPGSYVFCYRMFADDPRPVFLGNSFYGLRKEFGSIEWDAQSYRVRQATRLVFESSGAPTGPWTSHGSARDGLADLRETFAGPILGRRPWGQYVESHFYWDLDGSRVCPIEVRAVWSCAEVRPRGSARSADGYSFAVRGMRWLTGVPRSVAVV